jgi:hypothetical protein
LLKNKDAQVDQLTNQTNGGQSHDVSARGEQQDQSAKKVREAKMKPLISPTKAGI